MSRITITDDNDLPKVIKALNEVKSLSLEIGVFGSGTSYNEQNQSVSNEAHTVMVARVNEYGMDIQPKNSKYLTIPSNEEASKNSAGDFNDLFFIETDDGSKLLAKEKGKDKIEVYYVLVKNVTIPERSFMRSTYDEEENNLEKLIDVQLQNVINLKISPKTMYERVGAWLVSRITRKIESINSPPNANVTQEAKGSSNPLVDTGRLRQSISWRVV